MEIDLTALPAPQVVEEISFETILAAMKTDLVARFPAIEPTLALESAVVVKVLQVCAYREMIVRARINDSARANLLAFATGNDLEHLAAFYDVTRMPGEKDDRLKRRVILAIQGRSPGGTSARYASIAMAADIRVEDAIVYTVGKSPIVHVAIFSTDPDGVAGEDLIAIVNSALQAPDKKMVNDTIIVQSAVRRVVNIEANVWLLPDTSLSVLQTMEKSLREAWAKTQALGRDFTERWWTARLMLDGVHRVEPVLPVGDVIIPPAEAMAIGTVTLNFMGRAY
ncbi:baseplate J/gp47 family protein [Agrobacterium tumefaciens]